MPLVSLKKSAKPSTVSCNAPPTTGMLPATLAIAPVPAPNTLPTPSSTFSVRVGPNALSMSFWSTTPEASAASIASLVFCFAVVKSPTPLAIAAWDAVKFGSNAPALSAVVACRFSVTMPSFLIAAAMSSKNSFFVSVGLSQSSIKP